MATFQIPVAATLTFTKRLKLSNENLFLLPTLSYTITKKPTKGIEGHLGS